MELHQISLTLLIAELNRFKNYSSLWTNDVKMVNFKTPKGFVLRGACLIKKAKPQDIKAEKRGSRHPPHHWKVPENAASRETSRAFQQNLQDYMYVDSNVRARP